MEQSPYLTEVFHVIMTVAAHGDDNMHLFH